jgi:hypothetical protein
VIPSVAYIGNQIGTHQFLKIFCVDLIALFVQETEQALVEESPVHINRAALGIGLEYSSKLVAGVLWQRVPEYFRCHKQ